MLDNLHSTLYTLAMIKYEELTPEQKAIYDAGFEDGYEQGFDDGFRESNEE